MATNFQQSNANAAANADLATVPQSETVELLSAIAQAASDPQVDAAKMEALWKLKRDIDDRSAKIAFTRAFVACRSEMVPVIRDAWNATTKSKWAKLETIDRSIKPFLDKHRFAFFFTSPHADEHAITVAGELMHTSGHSKPVQLTGPLDTAGPKGTANKSPMHGLGSSVSYLRRYLKVMAFDITLEDEDDDGSAAAKKLDQDQLNTIQDLIIACEMNLDSQRTFCRLLNVSSVEEIPSYLFDVAVTQLRAKLHTKGRHS